MTKLIDPEKIKARGQLLALKSAIDIQIVELRNETFVGYETEKGYSKLGDCIEKAREHLNNITILLAEVKQIDGVSK